MFLFLSCLFFLFSFRNKQEKKELWIHSMVGPSVDEDKEKKYLPLGVPFWWVPTNKDAEQCNIELKYEERELFSMPFYTNPKALKKGDALYIFVESEAKPVAFGSCRVTDASKAKRPRTSA